MTDNDCNGGLMVALTGDLAERLDFALGALDLRTRVRRGAGFGEAFFDDVLNCAQVPARRLPFLVTSLRAEQEPRLDVLARELAELVERAGGQKAASRAGDDLVPGGRDPYDHRTVDLEDLIAAAVRPS